MGYSTIIYAIDLNVLRAAVGSRDVALLKRLRPPKKSTKDPMQGPRVKLTRKGEILLNGQSVTFNELRTEVNRRKWKGTYLFTFIEDGRRTGRWSMPGSFALALGKAYTYTQFLGEIVCSSDEDLADNGEGDGISKEEASAELVEGRVSQPREGHQYGYGLERLCQFLGSRLATIEGKGGMLRALGFNTRLSKERSPVPLQKKRDDFPGIGYLTAEEVRREVERLRRLDLSDPDSDEIAQDRRTYLRCLQKARFTQTQDSQYLRIG